MTTPTRKARRKVREFAVFLCGTTNVNEGICSSQANGDECPGGFPRRSIRVREVLPRVGSRKGKSK